MLLCVALIGGTAFAQPVAQRFAQPYARPFAQPGVEENRARELLSSPVLVDRAWGVFWISRIAVVDLGPLLIDQLASMQPYVNAGSSSDEAAYIDAVFDAIILSQTVVPERVLNPFAEHWRDEVLIVVSRQQGGEEFVLQMRDGKLNKAQWVTVNNLLLRMRSGKFFLKTLSELPLTHTFVIVEENGGSFGQGCGAGCIGCGARGLPKGFPPIGLYQLRDDASKGDVLVAKGPRDAYYRRTLVATDRQAGWSVDCMPIDGQKDGLGYLAYWNDAKLVDAQQVFCARTTLHWRDAATFKDSAESALGEQVEAIQYFLDVARQRGAGELSGLQPKIATHVEDHRQSVEPIPQSLPAKVFTVR